MRIFYIATVFSFFCLVASGQNTRAVYGYYNINKEITVKDSEYYKYLNEVERENAEIQFREDKGYIDRAVDYYDNEDYESAYFYANKVSDTKIEWILDLKHWILCAVAAREYSVTGKDKYFLDSKRRMAKREVDPETMREINAEIEKYVSIQELDQKAKRRSNRETILIALGGTLGLALLLILGALSDS